MQLKLRRSQRDAGLISTSVVFCLDARAELDPRERDSLTRYKLYDQVIYNSEAAQRSLDKSVAGTNEGTTAGLVKGVFHLAMTALRLNVTVRSLERGQHIECKSLDELIAAEDAIKQACQNLKVYLDIAATFDGSEVIFDYSEDEPQVIAQAIRPEPILMPAAAQLAPVQPMQSLPPPDSPSPSRDPEYYEEGRPYDGQGNSDGFGDWPRDVSDATEFEGRPAKFAAITAGVVILILLLAMCHG